MIQKFAVVAALLVSSVSIAHADTAEDLTAQLIKVSRQFQNESAEGKEKLKPTLSEISKLTDQYLVSVAESGNRPAASLVDASHQVKQLLCS